MALDYGVEDSILEGLPEVQIDDYASFPHFLHSKLKQGGDAIAQISNATGEKVTYNQIHERSIKLAIALQKLGITKGDVISISSENRFEFTITAIAAMSIGAITATLNTLYIKNELVHAMSISKPKLIFCSPLTLPDIKGVMKDIPSLEKIVLYDTKTHDPSFLLYDDLMQRVTDISKFEIVKVDVHKHPIVILCSSGTTGLPKGVALSHYNFILVFHHLKNFFRNVSSANDCHLAIMPWFHAYGLITHLASLSFNLRYVFMLKFEDIAYLRAIEKYKITLLMLVPPIMVLLAKHPAVDEYDLSSLKEIFCGAAPLSKEIHLTVKKRTGVKYIQHAYGLTETTLAVLHNADFLPKFGSCGTVVHGTKAKVVDITTGKTLGSNAKGELCFKGPLIMLGYVGDKMSTQNLYDANGWLHTGDVGYYDEDKYFYVIDRIKELIKFKGFQVPPAEIEGILLECPAVKEAGVVGLEDEKAGELPTAFVVKQPNATITEKEIINFVAERVSYPKRLHGGVRFISEMPKNSTGKILRRKLRELLQKTTASKL